MSLLSERIAKNDEKIAQLERKRRELKRAEREKIKKNNNRLNYIVGELFRKHFPEIDILTPENNEQNREIFKKLDSFFSVLSMDENMHNIIRTKAKQEKENEDG